MGECDHCQRQTVCYRWMRQHLRRPDPHFRRMEQGSINN